MTKLRLYAVLAGIAVGLGGCASYEAQKDILPMAYLQKAQKAVQARNTDLAVAELNQAETAWLGANYPHRDPLIVIDMDALRDVGRARQSVQMGLWSDAEYYVKTAMTHPSAIQPIYPFF